DKHGPEIWAHRIRERSGRVLLDVPSTARSSLASGIFSLAMLVSGQRRRFARRPGRYNAQLAELKCTPRACVFTDASHAIGAVRKQRDRGWRNGGDVGRVDVFDECALRP